MIAFDTEFVGEDTYRPDLCLVQVATPEKLYLLDPFASGPLDEVRAQVREWESLGVDTLILGVGAVPFQVAAPDDVELLLHAFVDN